MASLETRIAALENTKNSFLHLPPFTGTKEEAQAAYDSWVETTKSESLVDRPIDNFEALRLYISILNG